MDLTCDEELSVEKSPTEVEEKAAPLVVAKEVPVKAVKDICLLQDDRVMKNLLKLEEVCTPCTVDYLRAGQPDLTPAMRKLVTEWMLQVCQECGCSPDVFLMAVNFLDRFLAKVHNVPKTRLQLIGTVCLLISSKFKETVPLPGERLIFYTDNSVTPEEIRDCELLVLQQLQWEISTATPMDFLDHILLRLGIDKLITEAQMDELRIRMETILALAVTEYTFSYLNPSLLAASTIQLVLSRFSKSQVDEELNKKLYQSISAISSDIAICVSQLEKIVPNYILRFATTDSAAPLGSSHSDYGSSISSTVSTSPPENKMADSSFIMVS